MSAPSPLKTLRPRSAPPDTGRPYRVGVGVLDPWQLWRALPEALRKVNPVTLVRNPVMFVTEVGAVLATGLAIAHPTLFGWLITGWLWLTGIFANLAEAVAESRGKAQADSLRRVRRQTTARRLTGWAPVPESGLREEMVPSGQLRRGDVVVVTAGAWAA
jgi:potassium-transporting ATPase ATP-binding subunit